MESSGLLTEWIYDPNDLTPHGTHAALQQRLRQLNGPAILYFEAANPGFVEALEASRQPTDVEATPWCDDCHQYAPNIERFKREKQGVQPSGYLLRTIASFTVDDWRDSQKVPNLSNPFRSPEHPWRLPGIPYGMVVAYNGNVSIVDGVRNPDLRGLDYLWERACLEAKKA